MSRYIDADKVTEAFVKAAKQVGNIGDQIAFRMMINEIPAADVRENVRGEWIEKYYESNETGETVFHGMIMCSACGHVPKVLWLSDFCPNCGAEMGGKS